MRDDAFLPLLLGTRAPESAQPMPPGRAALEFPDLDAPPARPAPAPPVPQPDPAPDREAETAALIEIAREAGFAEGLAEGERRGCEAEAARREAGLDGLLAATLSQVDTALARMRAEAAEQAEAFALLLLRSLDLALPLAAAREAPAMLERLLQLLGPVTEAPAGAVLRVPPVLLEQARARLDGTGLTVEADPALPPGDARISWRGGGLALVLAERRAAIREAMASLGFTDEEIPS
ncbi:hypothetical protein RGI145_04360 [Roseomonas gilardii]|uniref:Flagellar assembly protein H n=1 Tax=Roseomonas gilardii TaxID=257708 RepID=A0A1L7ACT7_9PROT|nr:hypothetical protein [Roseomonas gilardii]APT56449.1 hypothetical protein RGI145_04360 [Roseomonas gilardii]